MMTLVVHHLEVGTLHVEVSIISIAGQFMRHYNPLRVVILCMVVSASKILGKCLGVLIIGYQVAVDPLVHLSHLISLLLVVDDLIMERSVILLESILGSGKTGHNKVFNSCPLDSGSTS